MKFYLLSLIFYLLSSAAGAQYRAEFISYDIRSEADADMMEGSKFYRALEFGDHGDVWQARIEIPELWLDRDVFVRDPRFAGAARLSVNGHETKPEECVTPFLKSGENFIEAIGDQPQGFYLFSQPRIRVVDYVVSGHHDEEFRDAVLDLAVVVRNGFNFPETVTVGYDIYNPEGRLVDFVFRDFTIPGRSADTLRFYNKVVGTERFQYSAKNPALHRVTLSVRHNGLHTEYIPFHVGFGALGLPSEGAAYLDEPLTKAEYDAMERSGKLIFDCSATLQQPNDPALVGRFVERQQSLYFRNRNRANVVGWLMGRPVGNGYNMYKAYQWLKSVEPRRPVVYVGAEGEWNSDR